MPTEPLHCMRSSSFARLQLRASKRDVMKEIQAPSPEGLRADQGTSIHAFHCRRDRMQARAGPHACKDARMHRCAHLCMQLHAGGARSAACIPR
eukprot:5704999-Pleurochrysis_carterae.AAC.1